MKYNITFQYQAPILSNLEIYLSGDFNNWDKRVNRLKDRGGVYEITLQLQAGEYKYYFVINNKKVLDPKADTVTADDEVYSILKVTSNEEFIYIVPFRIKDQFNYEEISIVGDFNKWKPNSNRLYKNGTNFSTSLFLSNGSYQFKYLAKDNRWFNEEELNSGVDKIALDNRSKNSLLDAKKRSQSSINKNLILSVDSNKLVMKNEIIKIYRYSDKLFEFKAILPLMPRIKVTLQLNNELIKLDFIASDGVYCAFNKIMELADIDFIYSYKIIIAIKDFELYANQNTLTNKALINSVLVPVNLNIFQIDSDLANRVMYQIMPDRFCNGDLSLNPNFKEDYYTKTKLTPKKASLKHNQEYYHLADWDEIDNLTMNPYSKDKEADWFVFYGGDLVGVKKKIPYLKELGISLVYLNPIFCAKSPHRYDTIDFMKVDTHLGTNEMFKDIVDELHRNDIKVIIDIALNHCGVDFYAFKDTVLNGDKSGYWNWFDWKKWPLPKEINETFKAEDYYQCWWGMKDLPEFNFDLLRSSPEENQVTDIAQAQPNVDLVNYLLCSMKYWIESIGIDGFRLDVPEEVPFWFWKIFRSNLKKVNPDIYIVGEIWNHPGSWLQSEYFDAIMNYQSFKDPCVAYFYQSKLSLKSFINSVSSGLVNLPELVSMCQMNLLGSHDTIRIRRLVDSDLNKLKLALIFQFTFIGIPHIYYGDEVFLDGNRDPDNRRPFPWDYEKDENRVELLEFYKRLITLRQKNRQFSHGKITFIEHQHLLIYERWLSSDEKACIVIINNSQDKINISKYIEQYHQKLLTKIASNNISELGYYLATK